MRTSFDRQSWQQLYVRHRKTLFVAQAFVFVALGIFVSSLFWRTPSPQPQDPGKSPPTAAADETLWTCSMHPQIRQPKPGKCPLCGMDLIPIAKTAGGMRTLVISDESKSLMQVETVAR